MHQSKYDELRTRILATGKIKPNVEAKLRVERTIEQASALKRNKERLFDLRGSSSMGLFPKYSSRVLNKLVSFITKNESKFS